MNILRTAQIALTLIIVVSVVFTFRSILSEESFNMVVHKVDGSFNNGIAYFSSKEDQTGSIVIPLNVENVLVNFDPRLASKTSRAMDQRQ